MQRINTYQFYSLGHILHPLGNISEGQKIKELFGTLYSAQMWLQFLLNDRIIQLGVCKSSAQSLLTAVNTALEPSQQTGNLYDALQSSQPATEPEKELTWIEAYNIRNGLQTFETILGADLESLSTYFVSRKLGYDTKILIEDAAALLPSSVLPQLPAETSRELKQAGKCIAFDTATAAGFHIIRATESVIRKYYAHIVGRLPKPKMRNWGTYVKNLNAAGADKKITGFIDHIRDNYRNPVLHPEEDLTPDDAQVLLGVCVSAIIMMVTAMNTTAPKTSSLWNLPVPLHSETENM